MMTHGTGRATEPGKHIPCGYNSAPTCYLNKVELQQSAAVLRLNQFKRLL